MNCENNSIRAHSIQNARYLELLSRDGHVIHLTRRMEEGGPVIEFDSVGRNRASTFAGLCSQHDQRLFRTIDTREVDLDNPEHLFLLAYRAALRELHASCEAAAKIQASYLERVRAGIDPEGEPSPAGLYATQRLIVAYETHLYKTTFDEALQRKAFEEVVHDVIRTKQTAPSIAAAAMFSLDDVEVDDDVARVCLTILPLTSESTAVIFSYLRRDAGAARASLARILGSTGYYQLYEVSREVLNSCENFVISPDLFESWSADKRQAIRSYFVRTLFRGDKTVEDPNLYLFW